MPWTSSWEYTHHHPFAAADLTDLFVEALRLCKVQPDEAVLIFTDPAFPRPTIPTAGGPPESLAAQPYLLTASSEDPFEPRCASGLAHRGSRARHVDGPARHRLVDVLRHQRRGPGYQRARANSRSPRMRYAACVRCTG